MAIGPFGYVVLGGVTLTVDPETHEIGLQKRHSLFSGLGGVVTIQDFGNLSKDISIRMDGIFLDDATVQSLKTLFEVKGATYSYVDGVYSFTVFIREFVPSLYSWRAGPDGGNKKPSRYHIVLQVV